MLPYSSAPWVLVEVLEVPWWRWSTMVARPVNELVEGRGGRRTRRRLHLQAIKVRTAQKGKTTISTYPVLKYLFGFNSR